MNNSIKGNKKGCTFAIPNDAERRQKGGSFGKKQFFEKMEISSKYPL